MIPIFVVRFNMKQMEDKCIRLVAENTTGLHYELRVYDNAQDNEPLGVVWNRMVREEAEDETWLHSQDPAFLLLNTDCFVTPGWLDGLLKVMHAHSKIGFVGPMTNNTGSPAQKIDRDVFKRQAAHREKHKDVIMQHHISGFCLLIRYQAWEEAGGFDESCPFYGQESALIEKCWRLGWSTAVANWVYVEHLGGATAQRNGKAAHEELKKEGQVWFQRYLARNCDMPRTEKRRALD